MALVLALAPPKGTHKTSFYSEFTYQVYVVTSVRSSELHLFCTSKVPVVTDTMGNVQRQARIICMLILEPKGLFFKQFKGGEMVHS